MATVEFNRYGKGETLSKHLPPGDHELVQEFISERGALRGKPLSPGRVCKILFATDTLHVFSGVDFPDLTMKHILKALDAIPRQGWTANTNRDVIAVVKPFLLWLIEERKVKLSREKVEQIKVPPPEARKIEPDELLSQEEIDLIIKAASPRDRAIISLMADAALRPVEAGSLRYSQLEFTDGTMFVHVVQKKGIKERKRRIPAPNAMYYVQEWINVAPYPIQGDDLLFKSGRFDRKTGGYPVLRDDVLRWSIRDAARKAGVKKYRSPYQFRHGAITRWLDAGISTAKVAKLSHGGPSLMVEAVYWHGDDKKIGDEILAKVHGRKEKAEKVKANPTSRICPTCGRIYPLSVRFCTTCGPLTEEAKISQSANIMKLLEIFAGMTPEEIKEVQETVKHR